ncbi:DUF2784 domain-containing protein [Ferrimonas balearica]|uniref:DUF2784 domain-containing protein n=1 Tax=Ferrimonas balearica TaxID=44012 RepID=UPI001C99FD57|nr:DUF2784 domain-containing protein [Ferrimonas balearica]MBY5993312.1 DUF2784 domain-containing protein [Ferrimonas balearica]
MPDLLLLLAADLVLVLHLAFVLFVIGGLLVIWLGWGLGWGWVHHRGFRWAHLAAIAVVVAQAWLGQLCPLTILEQSLRSAAGAVSYQGSFIQHYLHRLLYFEAPWWVFTLAYTLFALLVVITWWGVPPAPKEKRRNKP